MDVLKLLSTLGLWICQVEGRVDIAGFLRSFVENEGKATMVVLNGICWESSLQVQVMKELSKAGIRSSAIMSKGESYLDDAILHLTDLDCPDSAEVIENATWLGLHRLPYRWLVLSSVPLRAAAPLWDPFLVNSDLVVAEADGKGYKLTELHKPAANLSAILTLRGFFHETLVDVRPHREYFRRRNNVMGATLTMTNVIHDSNSSKYHLLQETSRELHNDLMAKNGWSLSKMGFLSLNATPKAVFAYRFGYIVKGEWTGLVRELIDYKADIATNMGMNRPRLKVVTFVDTMDNSRAGFVYRLPALSLNSNVFSLPFSPGVWMATGISAFISCMAFYLSTKLIGKESGCDGVMADAFLVTTAAISQQGCDVLPRNVASRIVLWVLFTALMALFVAYSANIVVLLQAPSNTINNLEQLTRSKMTIAANDVDYSRFIFKGGADVDPIRNEIARKIFPEKGPNSLYKLNKGVEKIRNDMFAFHSLVEPVYRQIEKTFQETEKCDLMEVQYLAFSRLYSPASKSSPYLELLRVVYKRLWEVGLKSAINFRYEVRKPSCRGAVAMFSSVGLVELRPVLLFLSYGVALSVAVFMAEHLVFHANRLRQCQLAQRFLERRYN